MESVLIPSAIAAVTASIGALVCYIPARRGRIAFSATVLATLAALFLWLWLKARALIGWDAMGYTIFAMLFVAPAFIGGAFATLIARHRRNRANHTPAP